MTDTSVTEISYPGPWEPDAYFTADGRLIFLVRDANQKIVCQPETREQRDAIVASRNEVSHAAEIELVTQRYEQAIAYRDEQEERTRAHFISEREMLEKELIRAREILQEHKINIWTGKKEVAANG